VVPFQVAPPLKKSSKYTTRSTSQRGIYSFPEPEKVYRRRLNRLAPKRLLESLGEEALTDIQFLFQTNNQPTINNPTNTPNVTIEYLFETFELCSNPRCPTQFLKKPLTCCRLFRGIML
jgi:hypothetical protein